MDVEDGFRWQGRSPSDVMNAAIYVQGDCSDFKGRCPARVSAIPQGLFRGQVAVVSKPHDRIGKLGRSDWPEKRVLFLTD